MQCTQTNYEPRKVFEINSCWNEFDPASTTLFRKKESRKHNFSNECIFRNFVFQNGRSCVSIASV